MPPWPAPTVCDHGQGWHSPTGSRTQQVRSLLDILVHSHGQPRFTECYTAPPGAMVSDVPREAQGSPQVSVCERGASRKGGGKRRGGFGAPKEGLKGEAVSAPEMGPFRRPKSLAGFKYTWSIRV